MRLRYFVSAVLKSRKNLPLFSFFLCLLLPFALLHQSYLRRNVFIYSFHLFRTASVVCLVELFYLMDYSSTSHSFTWDSQPTIFLLVSLAVRNAKISGSAGQKFVIEFSILRLILLCLYDARTLCSVPIGLRSRSYIQVVAHSAFLNKECKSLLFLSEPGRVTVSRLAAAINMCYSFSYWGEGGEGGGEGGFRYLVLYHSDTEGKSAVYNICVSGTSLPDSFIRGPVQFSWCVYFISCFVFHSLWVMLSSHVILQPTAAVLRSTRIHHEIVTARTCSKGKKVWSHH